MIERQLALGFGYALLYGDVALLVLKLTLLRGGARGLASTRQHACVPAFEARGCVQRLLPPSFPNRRSSSSFASAAPSEARYRMSPSWGNGRRRRWPRCPTLRSPPPLDAASHRQPSLTLGLDYDASDAPRSDTKRSPPGAWTCSARSRPAGLGSEAITARAFATSQSLPVRRPSRSKCCGSARDLDRRSN
jgi:hypothetical protein